MTETHNKAFNALLSSWNAHQDLRQNKASVDQLFTSRTQLDAARILSVSLR